MKKQILKIGIITLIMICFSIPSFASKSGIRGIINKPASSAFKSLQSKTLEAVTDALIKKQISDNAEKSEINIKMDESKKSVAIREADEASGKAAAEHKNALEANSSSNAQQNVKPQAKAKEFDCSELTTPDSSIDNSSSDNNNDSATDNNTNNTDSSTDNAGSSSTDNKPQNNPSFDSSIIPAGSLGIDVSEFNGYIDWQAVANSGVKFAYIRVAGRFSVSASIYDDARFDYNIAQAKANGIKVGVYFFTQAVNADEAIEEARYTIEKIKPYGVDLPIVIDSENVSGGGRHSAISTASRTEVIKAFCDEVSNAGYTPMLYASTWWLNNKLDMNQLNGYRVWVAQYYDKVTYGGSYNVWQYTSTGRITGVNGNVDCNYWYN